MPWPDSAPCHSQPDGARPPLTQRPRQLAPLRSASASCRVLSRHLAHHSHCRAHRRPQKRLETAANFQSTRIQARIIALVTPLTPSAVLAPSIGGFGFRQYRPRTDWAGSLGHRWNKQVVAKGQNRASATGVHGSARPLADWHIAQPVRVVPPVRAVGGAVEGDQRRSIRSRARVPGFCPSISA